MNVCLWSGSSFEEWYSSYHLMLKIIQEILAAGHEVWLVQKKKSDGKMPEELKNNSMLHVVNVQQKKVKKSNFILRYIRGFQYYKESGKIIKKIPNIDIIFLQSNNNALVPINVARKIGIPIVYNVQDIFPIDAMVIGKLSSKNPVYIITKKLQAKAYKRANRVVTISEDLAKTLQQEGCDNVEIIYNWSYQNEPFNIPDEKNHFLVSNKIKREDGFRVIYAGNVGQMMESEMIVKTAKVLTGFKDIKFYIIGEGSGLRSFKRRVEEENLHNIFFYARQPMEYAQDNYCAADVNINPIPQGVIYTCMPSKTATCLLSEKPTIVSMDLNSNMAKRLREVDQWTVIKPGDYQAMAEAIKEVYEKGSRKSINSAQFLNTLGPIENSKKYVRLLEDTIKNVHNERSD